VEDHVLWRSRPSIFISLFANKRHAENWALSWSARHNGDVCKIFEINAFSLTECVYQAEEIQRSCCSHIPEAAKASIADEYLVAYHIPIQAVERSWTTEDVKRKRRDQESALGWFAPRQNDMASQELLDRFKSLGI